MQTQIRSVIFYKYRVSVAVLLRISDISGTMCSSLMNNSFDTWQDGPNQSTIYKSFVIILSEILLGDWYYAM